MTATLSHRRLVLALLVVAPLALAGLPWAGPAASTAPAGAQSAAPTATAAATATATPGSTGPLRIRDIQGRAHRSPLAGRAVAGVEGIVTAVRPNGFYLQDPRPDRSPATAEGIFVFTRTRPTVAPGDGVAVDGTVAEFRPGGEGGRDNLSTTQISSPTVSPVSTGNPPPAAVLLGPGGRVPPARVIEDDAPGDVEAGGAFEPASDGLDFFESLEGMLVRVDGAVVVGPSNGFGEVVVLAADGAGAGPRTPRGGLLLRPDDPNPERVLLDDELLRAAGAEPPAADVGDRFPRAVGVVDYAFGGFRVQLTAAPERRPGGLVRETALPAGPDELAVATVNVENLDPSDGPEKYAALAEMIVDNLAAPDLLALEEVQDDTGAANDAAGDGVVGAGQTIALLVAAIAAASGPDYAFAGVDPVDGQDGGQPGGNIRVGFLYRTDRGLRLAAGRPGDATTPTTVLVTGDGPRLSLNPGRVAPLDPAFAESRKPLAAEFTFNGHRLFVVACHFASKSGDQAAFGRYQPPARVADSQRAAQARVVAEFVGDLLAVDPAAGVIVLGDLNDFPWTATVAELRGAGLLDLLDALPPAERYGYVFQGNSQALDHTLVSPALWEGAVAGYDIVHVNAEFAEQASDHDPQVARLALPPG